MENLVELWKDLCFVQNEKVMAYLFIFACEQILGLTWRPVIPVS